MVLKGYHIFLKITDLICMRTENIKKTLSKEGV